MLRVCLNFKLFHKNKWFHGISVAFSKPFLRFTRRHNLILRHLRFEVATQVESPNKCRDSWQLWICQVFYDGSSLLKLSQ